MASPIHRLPIASYGVPCQRDGKRARGTLKRGLRCRAPGGWKGVCSLGVHAPWRRRTILPALYQPCDGGLSGRTLNFGPDESLEHDPEKWMPVFRKRSCSKHNLERQADSKKRHVALVVFTR